MSAPPLRQPPLVRGQGSEEGELIALDAFGRRRIRSTLAARIGPVAAFAAGAVLAALLGGCGAVADDERMPKPATKEAVELTRIRWDAAPGHAGVLRVGGDAVWLVSEHHESGSNLWRIDGEPPAPRLVPLDARVADVVAGDDEVWAITRDSEGSARVAHVDVDAGYQLAEKDLSSRCGEPGGRSVVFDSRLWLECRESVLVFDRAQRGPVDRLQAPGFSGLLAASNGLWLALADELVGVAGEADGRAIPLPSRFETLGDYANQDAWAIDGTEAWAIGAVGDAPALLRVDLRNGQATATPLADSFYDDLALVGGEMWLATSDELEIHRYRRALPPTRLGTIGLGARGPAGSALRVDATTGTAWISVTAREFAIFRVDTTG